MDIFGTTITVMTEIYNITIFIRGVIAEVKAYDATKREIQDKLEHEFIFLNAFKGLFFDNEAVMRDDHVPMALKHDVRIILAALKRALTEYGMLAARHGLLSDEPSQSENESPPPPSFGGRLKVKAKDLKRTVDWALFDKDKMLKTLAEYSEWTGRLRQTMSLVLLTLSAFGSSALQKLANSKRAEDMGVQEVVARQMLVNSEPPADFTILPGEISAPLELADDQIMTLAKYDNGWGSVQEVVVEYRNYSKELSRATAFGLPELDQLKEPIRDLAWLLHRASFTDRQDELDPGSNQLTISTLPCLGYIDEPEERRTMFLYQIPRSRALESDSRIKTLHYWINSSVAQNQGGLSKPSLGNRFFIAYTLSVTLLNIHSSGWLHKNIWSHSIAIFPSTESPSPPKPPRFVPYLTGWGLARPILGSTDLMGDISVEANFYRHPVRQGYPGSPFKLEHDIYALGVVLLEIGLWKPVSCLFKKQMDSAEVDGRLPPPEMIRGALVDKARMEIASEMGESYAQCVEKCLKGDFGVPENERDGVLMSSAFRLAVADVIAEGLKL